MDIDIQFENKPLFFTHPQAIICCHHPCKLLEAFCAIESWLARGFYVAGFLSYEAGYCFEPCFQQKDSYDFPLLLMGVYKKPQARRRPLVSSAGFSIKNLHLSTTFTDYAEHIRSIRQYIAQGDVYQITYCIKLFCDFFGDAKSLYVQLLKNQPVPYPAYLETEQFKILSLSPERFIKKNNQILLAEPMKGTWPREKNIVLDVLARWRLGHDTKNRAENLMITDLLRNDLGRVAKDISVPKIFTVAKYNTLFQMTSTVRGIVPSAVLMQDLFSSIFPSGSVTGAPKVRAMQIIQDLEPFERKIYTGAIGYIAPDRGCYFNIPIRTILIEGSKAEMGIGGGIVWDSTPQGEWGEGMLKAKFFSDFSD